MVFKGIKKVHGGEFISRYDLEYETKSGGKKVYEMISRDPNVDSLESLQKKDIDAVVMIVRDPCGGKLLLNREFRPAVGEWVYNFPAGLINEGETPEEAAARELFEETGLTLLSIDEVWAPSYSAVGFSNERNIVMVCTADGTIGESNSEVEEIEARWLTAGEVRELLKTEVFAARTQAYCMKWAF